MVVIDAARRSIQPRTRAARYLWYSLTTWPAVPDHSHHSLLFASSGRPDGG